MTTKTLKKKEKNQQPSTEKHDTLLARLKCEIKSGDKRMRKKSIKDRATCQKN